MIHDGNFTYKTIKIKHLLIIMIRETRLQIMISIKYIHSFNNILEGAYHLIMGKIIPEYMRSFNILYSYLI